MSGWLLATGTGPDKGWLGLDWTGSGQYPSLENISNQAVFVKIPAIGTFINGFLLSKLFPRYKMSGFLYKHPVTIQVK